MSELASNFSEFDAVKAGRALGVEPRRTRDVAHGDGEALDVGDAVLEVYRDAGVTRVTTQDARIELFRVPSYSISGERVVFEQGGDQDNRSRLLVRNDGKVSFYPVLRATESPTTSATPPAGEQPTPPPPKTPDDTTRRYDSTPPTPEGQETEHVQLQGRLGRDPWYNSQGDQPIAGFPLAVNNEEGQTTWHKVVVFGDVAEQVDAGTKTGQIRKGRLVELAGSHVTREEPTTRGGVKRIVEFHASTVTRLTTTRTRPAR